MIYVIETTTATKKEAKFLSQLLIAKKLVACAQTQKIESAYIWKGQMKEKKEYLLRFKSTKEHIKTIQKLLAQHHSYEVCELIAYKAGYASEEYGEWIEQSVNG